MAPNGNEQISIDQDDDQLVRQKFLNFSQTKNGEFKNQASIGEVKKQNQDFTPPDGGLRAWIVLFCCFLTNGIIFSVINSFAFLYNDLHHRLEAEGVEDAAFKCSLVGSLAIGTLFFLSSFVGILADTIGLRTTAVCGGILATAGMAISTFFSHNITVLYFSYGVMFGAGASLAYTPSLTILGHYFHRHLGMVNGVVTAGSSLFTVAMSFLVPYILDSENNQTQSNITTHNITIGSTEQSMNSGSGLNMCLWMYTCMVAVLIVCGLSFKPLQPPRTNAKKESQSTLMHIVEKVIYLDNWRNKRYVIWALAVPCALFGYFVPYVHIVAFAMSKQVNRSMAASLMTCIGISSGIGRIICGKISDMPRVKANGNRIVVQQVSFISIGLFTMLLPAVPHMFDESSRGPALIVGCLIMGLFDGCFVTMQGIIAIDICGPVGGGQAIGFLLCMCSFPLTIGPPIAGALYDHFGNYTLAFILAGVPPIVGALLMLFIRRFPVRQEIDHSLVKNTM